MKTVTAMLVAPMLLCAGPALADGGGDDQAAAAGQRDFTGGTQNGSINTSASNPSSSSCCLSGWNQSLYGSDSGSMNTGWHFGAGTPINSCQGGSCEGNSPSN
jgi:hypothetical protein